jgi:hypothetical protein
LFKKNKLENDFVRKAGYFAKSKKPGKSRLLQEPLERAFLFKLCLGLINPSRIAGFEGIKKPSTNWKVSFLAVQLICQGSVLHNIIVV